MSLKVIMHARVRARTFSLGINEVSKNLKDSKIKDDNIRVGFRGIKNDVFIFFAKTLASPKMTSASSTT